MDVFTASTAKDVALDKREKDFTKKQPLATAVGDLRLAEGVGGSAHDAAHLPVDAAAAMADLPEDVVKGLILLARADRSSHPGSAPPQLPSDLEQSVLQYLAVNLPRFDRAKRAPPAAQSCQSGT